MCLEQMRYIIAAASAAALHSANVLCDCWCSSSFTLISVSVHICVTVLVMYSAASSEIYMGCSAI